MKSQPPREFFASGLEATSIRSPGALTYEVFTGMPRNAEDLFVAKSILCDDRAGNRSMVNGNYI